MRDNYCTVVTGRGVTLIPYRRCYVPLYHEWMSDPWLRDATGTEAVSLDEEHRSQERWRDEADRVTFLVCDNRFPSSGGSAPARVVGDVNLILDCDGDGSAEVMVMIADPESRRCGLATQAVQLMMYYASSRLRVTRFVAKIGATNDASLALFKRLGYVETAVCPDFDEVHVAWSADADADADADALTSVASLAAIDDAAMSDESADDAHGGTE